MTNGSIITSLGKNIILNRAIKSVPDYTALSKFKIGIANGTPVVSSTDLDYAVPISNGTVVDNGDQILTGSSGGDNTTDNSSIYKEGAGQSDGKSQNLIANATNENKIWTLTPLTASFVGTKPFAFWLYIKDAIALAKLVSFSLTIRTNGDAANKYYIQTFLVASLAVGWNWCTSNIGLVSAMTQGAGGVPSGAMNEMILTAITNNATDTFIAGDLCYDLMRQWETTDLTKTYMTSYPTINETNFEGTIQGQILSTEANGFNINSYGDFNTDGTNKMGTENTITAESKSSTDQFTFITKLRLV